ncbi:MAG: ABC transporter permease [Armatimonadetes bacterium]|nr:ABC transporter permease [Armatimonadota bacterium]
MTGKRVATFSGLALAFLGIWQLVAGLELVPAFMLPSPLTVMGTFVDAPTTFLKQAGHTARIALTGFAISVFIGVVLAVAITQNRYLEDIIFTLLVSMSSMPKVAIAPLLIIWLGVGAASKIVIAALIGVFALVIELVHGLRSIDQEMLDLGRVLQGNRWRMFAKIRLPHALPSLFAGMKVSVSLCLIGTIVGEFVASQHGLGHMIMVAQGQFDTPSIFVALVMLAMLGTGFFFTIHMIERLVLPWHVSHRTDRHAEVPA